MKRITISIFILSALFPVLAVACIPPVSQPFERAADKAIDAVIGHFNPSDKGMEFVVVSSLRDSIKPGHYRLTATRMGSPIGSRCPWETGPLYQMPDGATTEQSWMLLTYKFDNDTLYLGNNIPYAVQLIGARLVSHARFRVESAESVDEKQFIRWFISKPTTANSNAANQNAIEEWQDTFPIWEKSKDAEYY